MTGQENEVSGIEERVKGGGFLLSVHFENSEPMRRGAEALLKSTGADDVFSTSDIAA